MSQRIVCEWMQRFKIGRTRVKHEDGAGRLPTSITVANTERVRDMIPQNRRVTADEVTHQLQISHGTAYETIHNRLAFHRSVHVGSHSNSQNCTKRNVWISANGLSIVVVLKATNSWKESSWERKHGSTITSQRVNARVWNANILIRPPRKIQNPSNCRITCTCSFFFWGGGGNHRGYYWNTIKRGFNSKQCSLQ